jgi:3',5'-cyclic AMP phosphodiesterase CpdA
MRGLIYFFVFILLLAVLNSCRDSNGTSYSFFVAGHIYGKPTDSSLHIYPPFKKQFTYIRSYPDMIFGIFTGDIVRHPTKTSFDTLVAELTELGLPYHIAPGNHDMGNPELYKQYFGDHAHNGRTYLSFVHHEDLFIILDGNLNRENITGGQLEFLRATLENFSDESNNIFVFVHQLIWWNKNNEFRNVVTNWPPVVPDTNNFSSVVSPMLAATGKPVYLFAGDLGANHLATPFMYHEKGNLHFIGSGMGQGKDDNFIIVRVGPDGQVNLELIALQGSRNRLGRLEDYKLP